LNNEPQKPELLVFKLTKIMVSVKANGVKNRNPLEKEQNTEI
jgi:hypothetical protein